MGSRVVDLLAGGDRTAWPLAGDQLYVDLDLGVANLPAGTQLAIGDAVIEVTEPAHTGCAKFSARFGSDALRFVNSPEGRALRLRGLNARVVRPGTVRRGDAVRAAAADAGGGAGRERRPLLPAGPRAPGRRAHRAPRRRRGGGARAAGRATWSAG